MTSDPFQPPRVQVGSAGWSSFALIVAFWVGCCLGDDEAEVKALKRALRECEQGQLSPEASK